MSLIRWFLRLTLLIWGAALIALLLSRAVDLPQGTAARGKILYNNNLYCAACHLNDPNFAPLLPGVAQRAVQQRFADVNTVEFYLAQSVIDPNHVIVPDYPADMMPQYHLCPIDCRGLSVTLRDLQDLVAYLRAL